MPILTVSIKLDHTSSFSGRKYGQTQTSVKHLTLRSGRKPDSYGFKKLFRFYGNDTGKAIADYLTIHDETVDDSGSLTIFDPEATWKKKEVYDFTARELQVPVFRGGELVYDLPSLPQIRAYCLQQVDTLWEEVKRFDNPHKYYVDLSQKLWNVKHGLLEQNG